MVVEHGDGEGVQELIKVVLINKTTALFSETFMQGTVRCFFLGEVD
jgi:hypothetical protein